MLFHLQPLELALPLDSDPAEIAAPGFYYSDLTKLSPCRIGVCQLPGAGPFFRPTKQATNTTTEGERSSSTQPEAH